MRMILANVLLLLILASLSASSNEQLQATALVTQEEELASGHCTQPAAVQAARIREAEKGKFTLRRMELVGNVSTTDEGLHRRIASRMEEGNLFSARNLIASLKNVSGIETIYPVTMKDVVVRLDKAEKTLNLRICFKERPQNSIQSDDKIYEPAEVDRKAKIIDKPDPTIPEEARRNRVCGQVVLRIVLKASGEIGDIIVLKTLPDGLTEESLRVARQIKFEPAVKNDRPVSQYLRFEYTFFVGDCEK